MIVPTQDKLRRCGWLFVPLPPGTQTIISLFISCSPFIIIVIRLLVEDTSSTVTVVLLASDSSFEVEWSAGGPDDASAKIPHRPQPFGIRIYSYPLMVTYQIEYVPYQLIKTTAIHHVLERISSDPERFILAQVPITPPALKHDVFERVDLSIMGLALIVCASRNELLMEV